MGWNQTLTSIPGIQLRNKKIVAVLQMVNLTSIPLLSERTGIITGHGKFEIYNKPNIVIQENEEKYKNQYRPYGKRADDDSYFPMDGNKDSDQLEFESKSLIDDKVSLRTKWLI